MLQVEEVVNKREPRRSALTYTLTGYVAHGNFCFLTAWGGEKRVPALSSRCGVLSDNMWPMLGTAMSPDLRRCYCDT